MVGNALSDAKSFGYRSIGDLIREHILKYITHYKNSKP